MNTVTDLFCGAGGSSVGAAAAGAEVRLAFNHWNLAVETHNSNFPDTTHVCADVSQADPRYYPSTAILIASPECTHHTNASGRKRHSSQMCLLDNGQPDPAAERSRATMWDVPRFAEFHDYQIVIVENVVEARKWRLFDAWIQAMHALDYHHCILYLNSQFFGVPQSRDRMYVVFWKKSQTAPDLDYRPPAYCPTCEKVTVGVQSWKKPNKPWGRYGQRRQYVYRCPACAGEVLPGYVPASAAIDWTLRGEIIRDRKRPLKPRTMERIRRGLERFGLTPVMLETTYSHAKNDRNRSVNQPMMTQTSRQSIAISVHDDAYITEFRRTGKTRPVSQPLGTVTAGGNHHGLLIANYTPGVSRPTSEPMGTVTTVDHHALVTGENEGLLISYYTPGHSRPTSQPMLTVTTENRHALILPYYNTGRAQPTSQPLPTVTTVDRHAFITSVNYFSDRPRPVTEPLPTQTTASKVGLTEPGAAIAVEDCRFRMLQPHEIGAAMSFPRDYVVLGNKKDQVRQYGNAVTPPVMHWIASQCLATL